MTPMDAVRFNNNKTTGEQRQPVMPASTHLGAAEKETG